MRPLHEIRAQYGDDYADRFITPIPVYFYEGDKFLGESTVMDLPWRPSKAFFCQTCGEIWGRIMLPDRLWSIEYSYCLNHRNSRKKPEVDYITESSHAIFGSQYPTPKRVMERDFLVLCSYYPELWKE